jgi:hypothetical protein
MESTLKQGDFLRISELEVTEAKVLRLFGWPFDYVPRPGEVVVFRLPKNPV